MTCAVCGCTGPDVIERDVPLRTAVCDACWAAATREPEPVRELAQELIEQMGDDYGPRPSPREGTAATCSACGAHTEWHKTRNGRWIMMELHEFPTGQIAVGHRWRIAGDGTALNLGHANPAPMTRVSHFDACPARTAPTHSPALLRLWRRRAGHSA